VLSSESYWLVTGTSSSGAPATDGVLWDEETKQRKGTKQMRCTDDSLHGTLNSTPVLIGSKVLIVEHPNQKMEQYGWDKPAKQRFQLNEADADDLEHGAVLWRGSTAFLVEPKYAAGTNKTLEALVHRECSR
jgi:hypothetical protein